MDDTLFGKVYNPDVLSCLANLSNDEVFTPPEIVNQMLDMLPQALFKNPDATFLDPACKTGVFLREIAKRLIKGLESHFPDLQERIDHIFHKQLFGIAITELTGLLARRGVYCSKSADGAFSVSKFENADGNIRYKRIPHTWKNGKCIHCGVSKKEGTYDRSEMEIHAYEWIHTAEPKEIFKVKFDVIIGNPPYQLNIGVEKENYAMPIYQKFVEQSKRLNPRYLSMIIPSRWYAGGRGLDDFRDEMLHDSRIREIHDFPNSAECFPGVDLAGGVCFFLWDRDNSGECRVVAHNKGTIKSKVKRPLLEKNMTSFIRHNEAISILRKIQIFNEDTFDKLVSPQTPFGLVSSFRDFSSLPFTNAIKYYTYGYQGYIKVSQISKNFELVASHKVYISKAYGERGTYPFFFLGKPFYGEPNSCCSQSYLVIGPFNSKEICENVISYVATKFFRCMIMLKKNAQDNMRYVFECVPMQDFSKPWTDEELYAKYNLSQEEIDFIESMIRPME